MVKVLQPVLSVEDFVEYRSIIKRSLPDTELTLIERFHLQQTDEIVQNKIYAICERYFQKRHAKKIIKKADLYPIIEYLREQEQLRIQYAKQHQVPSLRFASDSVLYEVASLCERASQFNCYLMHTTKNPRSFLESSETSRFNFPIYLYCENKRGNQFYFVENNQLSPLSISKEDDARVKELCKKGIWQCIASVDELHSIAVYANHVALPTKLLRLQQPLSQVAKKNLVLLIGSHPAFVLSGKELFQLDEECNASLIPLEESSSISSLFPQEYNVASWANAQALQIIYHKTGRTTFAENRFLLLHPGLKNTKSTLGGLDLWDDAVQPQQFIISQDNQILAIEELLQRSNSAHFNNLTKIDQEQLINHSKSSQFYAKVTQLFHQLATGKIDLLFTFEILADFLALTTNNDDFLPVFHNTISEITLAIKNWLDTFSKAEYRWLNSVKSLECGWYESPQLADLKERKADALILQEQQLFFYDYKKKNNLIKLEKNRANQESYEKLVGSYQLKENINKATPEKLQHLKKLLNRYPTEKSSPRLDDILCTLFRIKRPYFIILDREDIDENKIKKLTNSRTSCYLVTPTQLFYAEHRYGELRIERQELCSIIFDPSICPELNQDDTIYLYYSATGELGYKLKNNAGAFQGNLDLFPLINLASCQLMHSTVPPEKLTKNHKDTLCYVLYQETLYHIKGRSITLIDCSQENLTKLIKLFPAKNEPAVTAKPTDLSDLYAYTKHRPSWPFPNLAKVSKYQNGIIRQIKANNHWSYEKTSILVREFKSMLHMAPNKLYRASLKNTLRFHQLFKIGYPEYTEEECLGPTSHYLKYLIETHRGVNNRHFALLKGEFGETSRKLADVFIATAEVILKKSMTIKSHSTKPTLSKKQKNQIMLEISLPNVASVTEMNSLLRIMDHKKYYSPDKIQQLNKPLLRACELDKLSSKFYSLLINYLCCTEPSSFKECIFHVQHQYSKENVKKLKQFCLNRDDLTHLIKHYYLTPKIKIEFMALLSEDWQNYFSTLDDYIEFDAISSAIALQLPDFFYKNLVSFLYRSDEPWNNLLQWLEKSAFDHQQFLGILEIEKWLATFPPSWQNYEKEVKPILYASATLFAYLLKQKKNIWSAFHTIEDFLDLFKLCINRKHKNFSSENLQMHLHNDSPIVDFVKDASSFYIACQLFSSNQPLLEKILTKFNQPCNPLGLFQPTSLLNNWLEQQPKLFFAIFSLCESVNTQNTLLHLACATKHIHSLNQFKEIKRGLKKINNIEGSKILLSNPSFADKLSHFLISSEVSTMPSEISL